MSKFGSGDRRSRASNRALAAASQPIVDEARIAAMKVDGSAALAGHAMDAAKGLDNYRRQLAGGDETLNNILVDIEVEGLRQVKKIQAKLYNEFGI